MGCLGGPWLWPGKKGEQRVEYQDIEANLPVEQILPNRSCTALGRWVPSQVLIISKVERFTLTDNGKHKSGNNKHLQLLVNPLEGHGDWRLWLDFKREFWKGLGVQCSMSSERKEKIYSQYGKRYYPGQNLRSITDHNFKFPPILCKTSL